jgi:alpha/beta superfamily hydrolase
MNNKVVVDTFHTFMDNDFSVCRVNFRGVGKSDGEFDNGQGELADAAAALDWLERENFDNSQCLGIRIFFWIINSYAIINETT